MEPEGLVEVEVEGEETNMNHDSYHDASDGFGSIHMIHHAHAQPTHPDDYTLKDVTHHRRPSARDRSWAANPLGVSGGRFSTSPSDLAGDRSAATTHDLVESMYYLYIRVVRARDLPTNPATGACDPYVELRLGNYRGTTRHLNRKPNPEWNQVFAFARDRVQSSLLEVLVRNKAEPLTAAAGREDAFLGRVAFDLHEVPTRVPPDSPLAPQWYRLEDPGRRRGSKIRGEVMLAVWVGSQADEAFSEALHADAATVPGGGEAALATTRSKVYVSPKLWYVRVNVIEAQDVQPSEKGRVPDVFVRAQVGSQVLRTTSHRSPGLNPMWNEDLVFVAAEPFEENLVLTVEDHVNQGKDEVVGKLAVPLSMFEKRLDHRPVDSRWFNLERFGFGALEGERRREMAFSSRVHLRCCLEGAYHVMDESTLYTSDHRPTARQLWKQPVGVLEVGILGATGLLPMKSRNDGRGSTDAYCVAKYGQKWVRTRTILNSFVPKWNEQYTWEVFDPCTVITLGVFDNSNVVGGIGNGSNNRDAVGGGNVGNRDARIGKVRIRVSTLEADKVYTHSYPLLVLLPSGVKKMGELQLAVRFTCMSLPNTIYLYGQPPLPKMHYVHPFTVTQVDSLRYQAIGIVATRLGRAEPPLRREVVEYMLDVDSHMWSMRRSKANFYRVMVLISGPINCSRWLSAVRHWRNPATTVLVHVLFLILLWCPELILPTLLLYTFVVGLWNYRSRPRHPAYMDTRLSWADSSGADELDEEFDTFPTTRPYHLVQMRYDRLRSVAARVQTVTGDVATQGERLQSLLTWRDPRATALFLGFCLVGAVVLYVTPFRVVALVAGLYGLRHPRFRSKLPAAPLNFFRRLPSKVDSLI